MRECRQAMAVGWSRGWTLRDRIAAALFCLLLSPSLSVLKSRPRARALVARLWPVKWLFRFREGLFTILVRTPTGPSRLVFDPLDDNECVVAEELLLEHIYLMPCRYSLFVDAGAFRGISTIFLQDQAQAQRVIAIEPGGKNYDELQRRLRTLLPEAGMHRAAVATAEGEANFSGEGIGGKLSGSGSKVKLLRIPDVAELRNAPDALIKMDIEGSETEVLPDLLPHLPAKCLIFLETHQAREEADSLVEMCRQKGFCVDCLRSRPDWHSDCLFIDWKLERSAENQAQTK